MGQLIRPFVFDPISRVRARSGADAASRAAFCQAMARNPHARAASLALAGGGGGGGGGTATLVQSNAGYSGTSASFSPAFGVAGTAGNIALLKVVSGGYLSADPSGWTLLSTDGNAANVGSRVYVRLLTGTDPCVVNMGGAYNAAWTLEEWNGLSSATPLATMTVIRGGAPPTWTALVPTAGKRLIWVAAGDQYNVTSANWSNANVWGGGFTGTRHGGANTTNTSGPGLDAYGCDTARLYLAAADGVTGYTPTLADSPSNTAVMLNAANCHVSHALIFGVT